MDILPVNFKVLQFCGAWRERIDDNACIKLSRFCYKYAIVFLIYEFTILDVVEIIRTRDRILDLTEGLFLGLTFVTLSIKYANFLLRKNELSTLLDCLREQMCQPRNSMEKMILEEHNRKAKRSTISFLALSYTALLSFLVTTAMTLLTKGERVLPVKSYIPYSVSDLLPYLFTCLQQLVSMFYAIMLNVSFDSLVYGFAIHACAQIELMCCRLTRNLQRDMSSGRTKTATASIEECVRHHLLVNILVKKTRALFIWTVMIFFFSGMFIVCTSIFLISKKKLLSTGFFSMLLYLSGIMLQLFYYCWYGNELELKSKSIATAIYSSDWLMTTPRERKLLMLVMLNSQKGIAFSYHGIFALSLDTFTWICRASYSAYNLLQQASK
ncbi:odorant receptor 46a-like [Pseudomyrmex gracilis]|uniref:odorant receptor 46a-like n=1 Tax=Pseudomyrmex gracilis TaxID=219809 RepID=UPI000994E945|nr:odorant receptor 46a-like [Pseudomyrmex gracilis]